MQCLLSKGRGIKMAEGSARQPLTPRLPSLSRKGKSGKHSPSKPNLNCIANVPHFFVSLGVPICSGRTHRRGPAQQRGAPEVHRHPFETLASGGCNRRDRCSTPQFPA